MTVLGHREARSATEATVEPPDTMSRNQGAKIPDGRLVGRLASIGLSDGVGEGYPIGRQWVKARRLAARFGGPPAATPTPLMG